MLEHRQWPSSIAVKLYFPPLNEDRIMLFLSGRQFRLRFFHIPITYVATDYSKYQVKLRQTLNCAHCLPCARLPPVSKLPGTAPTRAGSFPVEGVAEGLLNPSHSAFSRSRHTRSASSKGALQFFHRSCS
jgi:hypothetical protein